MTFLFYLLLNTVHGQGFFDKINSEESTKSTFITCRSDSSDTTAQFFETDVVIKFSETEFESVIDTIDPEWDGYVDSVFQYLLMPSLTEFKYLPCLDHNCLSTNPAWCSGFEIYVSETGHQTMDFRKDISVEIVHSIKVSKPASVEFDNRKFETIVFGENEFVKHFKNEQNNIFYLKLKAGYWRLWDEMICSHMSNRCAPERTTDTIASMKRILNRLGYYSGPFDNEMTNLFKESLIKFQRYHKLPIGQLDLRTIKMLHSSDFGYR